MKGTYLIAAAVACVVPAVHAHAFTSAAPTPPFWGPVWTAPFNQSITVLLFQWNNTVRSEVSHKRSGPGPYSDALSRSRCA